LKNLNLGSNKIKTLPKTDLWTSLEELRVGSNNLVMLPTFSKMTALTFLKLDQNKALGELPEFPPNIENLEVQSTACTNLPVSIEHMTVLKTLNASSCALTALPALGKLSALDTLNVSTNKLTTLPGIQECGSLRVLLFQGNKVEEGPELTGLFSLERVMCGDNPLSAASRQRLQNAQEICSANGGWMKGL
jgi:Leucine-rich repeat (LRR) protein